MSLLPAYFGARRRDPHEAPPEPEVESHNDVFRLIPPRAETFERFELPEPQPEPQPQPQDNEPVAGAMDLTRISIHDGHLYWDGQPVEVRRKLTMSRAQVVAATLLTLLVMIAAVGAAMQGLSAAHEWACRVGWTTSYCTATPGPPPVSAPRFDIPA